MSGTLHHDCAERLIRASKALNQATAALSRPSVARVGSALDAAQLAHRDLAKVLELLARRPEAGIGLSECFMAVVRSRCLTSQLLVQIGLALQHPRLKWMAEVTRGSESVDVSL
jgi:hypothetical protein